MKICFLKRNMGEQKHKKISGDKTTGGEFKRRSITLKEKLEVIKRFERNERTCDIVRATGIKESTLRTIRDNAERIKASVIAGTSLSASKSVRMRSKIIEEMEKILTVWLEKQTKKQSEIGFSVIKEKALSTYEGLKKKSANPSAIPDFTASSGWFAGFKNRHAFLTLSSGNQMRKSPQTTLGPRELLRPNIEAEAQEQTDFTPDNVENVEEMKEEIQEDQTDCSMTLMVSDNQSSDMTQQETDSVVMDTYQPSSKRLLVVPEHQYSMMSSLSSMWKEQKMCDASIGNGTTIIMVHKVVLMAISPTLLSSSEVRNNCFLRVNFPANISENAMRAFAEYMYNGLLDLDPLTLTQLQQISYQLGIEELRMLCKTHLCSQSQGSSSIDNIICPGTSLTHLATQSDSFSPQLSVQRKQNPVLEINKRNLLTKSWPQCPGGEGFVSHGPVVVKTEPQNSVQLDCSENLTMQTHTVRPMPTGWPVNEISHSQGSSSTSVTKTGQTSKTFQEHHDRTLESQLVSHIKMEPLDHTASEYGQHYPSLNSDASAPNFPLTKTDPFCATGDCSDSTKFTSVASPAMSTISNFQQKYARNRVKDVQNTPLLRSTIRKVVPSSGDESAMLTRTRNNCLNSTARKDSSTSNTPYPVMLFSSEMENLPLNISETKKAEQYVDLTS